MGRRGHGVAVKGPSPTQIICHHTRKKWRIRRRTENRSTHWQIRQRTENPSTHWRIGPLLHSLANPLTDRKLFNSHIWNSLTDRQSVNSLAEFIDGQTIGQLSGEFVDGQTICHQTASKKIMIVLREIFHRSGISVIFSLASSRTRWYETEALPISQIKYQFPTYSRRRQSNTTRHSLVSTGGMVVHRVEFLISYSTQTPSFAVEKFHRKDTIRPLLSTKIRYANHTPHTKLPYSASDHDNAAALVPPCCVVFLNGTPMLYRLLDSYDDI